MHFNVLFSDSGFFFLIFKLGRPTSDSSFHRPTDVSHHGFGDDRPFEKPSSGLADIVDTHFTNNDRPFFDDRPSIFDSHKPSSSFSSHRPHFEPTFSPVGAEFGKPVAGIIEINDEDGNDFVIVNNKRPSPTINLISNDRFTSRPQFSSRPDHSRPTFRPNSFHRPSFDTSFDHRPSFSSHFGHNRPSSHHHGFSLNDNGRIFQWYYISHSYSYFLLLKYP